MRVVSILPCNTWKNSKPSLLTLFQRYFTGTVCVLFPLRWEEALRICNACSIQLRASNLHKCKNGTLTYTVRLRTSIIQRYSYTWCKYPDHVCRDLVDVTVSGCCVTFGDVFEWGNCEFCPFFSISFQAFFSKIKKQTEPAVARQSFTIIPGV